MPSVSGIVKITNNPVERVVRVYKRSTGELIGSTTSDSNGNYIIGTPDYSEVYVVCLDEEEGERESLIHDKVIPI